MPLSTSDAPYSGGFQPGGRIFAVDGDFTVLEPNGPPEISFPLTGDSILSTQDVLVRKDDTQAPLGWKYQPVPVGNHDNLQPWSANQQAFVIDQKFMIAAEDFQPMPLNTRYNSAWALPWIGSMVNGVG